MTYRKNVTDKEQSDIERAEDDSAIRLQSFKLTDGQSATEGVTKMIPAYDMNNDADAGGSPNDGITQVSRANMVVGSHNDKPYRFAEPGKA